MNTAPVFKATDIKMAAKSEMEYIHSRVLAKFPLLGGTMSRLKSVVREDVERASTDSKAIYYNPNYIMSLTEQERMFVYAHEIMHVAFNHVPRCLGRDIELWNIATDAVINQMLKAENLPLPDDCVDIPDAINHSAEEMYDILLEHQKQKQNGQPQQGDQGQDQQQGGQPQQGDQGQDQQQGGQPQQGDQGQDQQQGGQPQQGDQGQDQQQDGQPQQGDQGQDQQQDGQPQQGDQGQDQQQGGQPQQGDQGQDQQQGGQPQQGDQGQDQQQDGQPQQGDQPPKQKTPQNNGDDNSSRDKLLDIEDLLKKMPQNHNFWEQVAKQMAQQPKAKKLEDNNHVNEIPDLEKNFLDQNKQERDNQIEQAYREIEMSGLPGIGSGAGNSDRSMGDIGKVEKSNQAVDWRKLLKKSVEKDTDKWSYRRSNAENHFMARVEEEEDEDQAETEVVLDVSGSVSKAFLREFLRQLKPLLKNSKLRVGFFDVEFYPFVEIKKDKDIDRLRIPGGGGTDMDVAVRNFSKKASVNKIVFTDGFGFVRDESLKKVKNLTWLVWRDGFKDFVGTGDVFKPLCGRVIYVDAETIMNYNDPFNMLINKSKTR